MCPSLTPLASVFIWLGRAVAALLLGWVLPLAQSQPVVLPTVDCVERMEDGRYRAYFGYDNSSATTTTVPVGVDNRYQGGITQDVPLENFEPGSHRYAFEATFDHRLTWALRTGGVKRMVRADQRHPDYDDCVPPDDLSEPSSLGSLALVGHDESGFSPAGSQSLVFRLDGAEFATDATLSALLVNGETLAPTSVSAHDMSFPVTLTPGRNDLHFFGVDRDTLGVTARYTLWAGSATQVVRVVDESGAPVSGAEVRFAIVDDLAVGSVRHTVNGEATFMNVPPRTLIATASTAEGHYGTAGALGDGALVPVTLLGFQAPSPVTNDDFSLGLDGWDITSGVQGGTVGLIPHEEEVGPGDPENTVVPEGFTEDLDLELVTGGEGVQRVTRSFTVPEGIRSVTVRYRFITTEVPGGYYGSEYNDYFGVAIRSQQAAGRATDQNSMNGLGLDSFDAVGGTAWREVTLATADAGDVVQIDLVVANVGDGAYPSRVVVDRVQGSQLAIASVSLMDNSLFRGSLRGCHGSTLVEPLQFFSVGAHTFWSGQTRVWGDLTITGDASDAVTDVRLEAIRGRTVLSSGRLSGDAAGDLIGALGSDGRIATRQRGTAHLFAVPSASIPVGGGGVSLRVRAVSANGAVAVLPVGPAYRPLGLYTGTNRFGSAGRDGEQGGDGWARPAVLQWAHAASSHATGNTLQFNDFTNMNGGKFPIHCTHRDGETVDVTYPGLSSKDAAAAARLLTFLNGPHGAQVARVQTTYPSSGAFGRAIANAGTLTDGRRASEVVSILTGHPTHMHVTWRPGGGTTGGRLWAGDGVGSSWQTRGPRGVASTAPALAGAPWTLEIQPNPVNQTLRFVQDGAPDHEMRADVYDALGRVVARVVVPAQRASLSTTLDTSHLAPGAYVLRVMAGERSTTARFIVTR